MNIDAATAFPAVLTLVASAFGWFVRQSVTANTLAVQAVRAEVSAVVAKVADHDKRLAVADERDKAGDAYRARVVGQFRDIWGVLQRAKLATLRTGDRG